MDNPPTQPSKEAFKYDFVSTSGNSDVGVRKLQIASPHSNRQKTSSPFPLLSTQSDPQISSNQSKHPSIWSPSNGVLVAFNNHSISFSIHFQDAKTDRKPVHKSFQRKQVTSDVIDMNIQTAEAKRKKLIENRRMKLKYQLDAVKHKAYLQRQKDRLLRLRLQSSIEFSLRLASLNRQIYLQKTIERIGGRSANVTYKALMSRLQKCHQLKRSFSTTFADILKSNIPEFDSDKYLEDETTSPKNTLTHFHATTKSLVPETASDTSSKGNSTGTMKKSHSVSFPIHLQHHDLPFLTDLRVVFPDNMPTITRATLRELDLEAVIGNLQLRHDMLFDPNLEFRPNDDGERGVVKRQKTEQFWQQIVDDVQGTHSEGKPVYRRVPVLLHEIRNIMLDLVANDDYKRSVEENIDVVLIAQQLEHGVLNFENLLVFIADTLKAHCAPARDSMIDKMLEEGKEGRVVEALKMCFEVLERMKLDVANDQLRRLRPYVVEHAVEFEWEQFKESLKNGTFTLQHAVDWLRTGVQEYKTSKKDQPTDTESLFIFCIMKLISNTKEQKSTSSIPETWRLDRSRLLSFNHDWQDITIIACLLTLYRQAIGPKHAENHTHLLEMKKQLWVLLNDKETTMSHISLHLCHAASQQRQQQPMTPHETQLMTTMIDKTLSPDSKVYELMYKRIGDQLSMFLYRDQPTTTQASDSNPQTNTSLLLNETLLKKYGLLELQTELQELGERIRTLVQHNRIVYAKVYNQILQGISSLHE